MNDNSVILLEKLLAKSRAQTQGVLAESDHATFWVAEQYLKTTGVSPDELVAGIVDGEKDCGVDAVYVFANGICISDDTPLRALGKNPRLELTLLQVKDSTGFGEDSIDKLIVNLPRLLRFDRDEAALHEFANSRLIEATRRFLAVFRDTEMPELTIFVVYASLRATAVHPNVVKKGARLAEVCGSLFGNCPVHVEHLGAPELYEFAKESRTQSRSLQLAENPISTDLPGGYVRVVRLRDYQRFITSDSGELDGSLFEANVRDYEGETPVNRSIEHTLSSPDDDVDFWWLNNGVTIVANEVQLANKLLKLQSPQVVNGLQTSTEIYKRGRASAEAQDHRSVLVKVIEARELRTRERIIRATNSQTSFGLSALRATDRVQRQIEDYLASQGLYYERRRRLYFNQGMPLDRIVSIETMGQALVSILVQAPEVARSTPSRIFEQEIYDLAFHPDHPVQIYAAAIGVLRQCDDFLRKARLEGIEDIRFQLAMVVAVLWTRKHRPRSADVATLENVTLDAASLSDALDLVQGVYAAEARRRKVFLVDQLAKNRDVTARLLEVARSRVQATRRP